MNLEKLNPWNWFKHEEGRRPGENTVPVTRPTTDSDMPAAWAQRNPVTQLHQEIDRLFEDAFSRVGFPSFGSGLFGRESGETLGTLPKGVFQPQLNVSTDDNGYQVSLEAPGLSEEDLNIQVKGDILSISGEKKEEVESSDRHFYRVERRYGAFQRTLALPDDVIADEISATMKDGVLNLAIPRRESVDSEIKRISIN